MTPLSIDLPPETLETIAQRVAALLADRTQTAEDRWLRGAEKIANYIDSPVSRVYALASARRIPVHRDGSALIARQSELDTWLTNGGGKRP